MPVIVRVERAQGLLIGGRRVAECVKGTAESERSQCKPGVGAQRAPERDSRRRWLARFQQDEALNEMRVGIKRVVIERVPEARLIIAGFGAYRHGLRGLAWVLGDGELAAARNIARRGRELEGDHRGSFISWPRSSMGSPQPSSDDTCRRHALVMRRVHSAGRIEHDDVSELMRVSLAIAEFGWQDVAEGVAAAAGGRLGGLPRVPAG